MSNLLIEIGNTALKAAWSQDRILGKTVRYQGERVMDFILNKLLEKDKPEILVVASVKDISEEEIEKLSAKCGQLVFIDKNHTDILKAYSLPEYLSPDRAASIIATRGLFKNKEVILFDFGTSLSVDFIAEDGSYKGGNVSLGCRTRFKALNRYARSLPLVNTPKEICQKGTSVVSSIESGIVLGIMFEIDGYIATAPQSVVVFTGGDANYFAKQTKNSIFVVCNLVLMGLAAIAEDYERK